MPICISNIGQISEGSTIREPISFDFFYNCAIHNSTEWDAFAFPFRLEARFLNNGEVFTLSMMTMYFGTPYDENIQYSYTWYNGTFQDEVEEIYWSTNYDHKITKPTLDVYEALKIMDENEDAHRIPDGSPFRGLKISAVFPMFFRTDR